MSIVSPQYQIQDRPGGVRRGGQVPASTKDSQMAELSKVNLLLKPNGAPVFQNVEQRDPDLDETLRRGRENPLPVSSDQNGLERTVRAHTLILGKAIQNQTNIAVLDVAKNSQALEQNFPVKVLYVKPGVKKSSSLKPKADARNKQGESAQLHQGIPSAINNENLHDNNLGQDINHQMDKEVSMGEISGIFKQPRNSRTQARRTQSESQKQAQQRAQTQKAYAEQVRQQSKIKEQQRQAQQAAQRAQAQSADAGAGERAANADLPEAALPENMAKLRVPHSSNRYQGQYQSLTKDLFRKAQAQVKMEKYEQMLAKENQRARKEADQQYLEDIKMRNQEIVLKQKERGSTGESLKQKEERLKQDLRREELRIDREKKRKIRAEREQESRAQLGLDQLDRDKLKEFQDKKSRDLLEQEATRRELERENKRKADERAKQPPRRAEIDFADAGQLEDPVSKSTGNEADDIALFIVDKKQILKEQKVKRRQEELQQQMKEMQLKQKRENSIMQLEARLKSQRDQLARKQQLQQERQAELAEQQRQAGKAASKRATSNKDRSEQLSELRGWIEEQMSLEDQVLKDQAAQAAAHSQTNKSKDHSSSQPASKSFQENQIANLVKHQLPGNNLLSVEDEKKHEARENRYGLYGANEFDEVVQRQRIKDGLTAKSTKSANEEENVFDISRRSNSPQKSDKKSDDSYDYQPVRGDRRVVINQSAQDAERLQQVPGIMSVQQEAARQQAEQEKEANAAVVMQKWARGWDTRRRVAPLRGGNSRAVAAKRAAFADHQEINDYIDFHKFMNEKPRHLMQGEDDSISEKIGESGSHADVQAQSQIPSQILGQSSAADNRRSAALVQNFFGPPQRQGELDPLSIISIFAKRNTVASSPEQMVPEKERRASSPKPDKRARAGHDVSQSKRSHQKSGRAGRQQAKKQAKQAYGDDEIEEDIVQSSKDNRPADERYSSDFASDRISESIASYQQASATQLKPDKPQDSSLIEESIHEQYVYKQPKDQSQLPRQAKFDGSGMQESIQEEDHLLQSGSAASASIVDEVIESKEADMISEESNLYGRPSDQLQSSSFKNKKSKSKEKIERIRENIEDDYANDGFGSYAQSLKAQKMRREQEIVDKQRIDDYRMSNQAIQDFEEQKGPSSLEHQRVMKDLAEELKRYEAAVSGSVFFERFQNTVSKSLAQKDVMMLGQRLSQLELENKHKQEIADIRAEQVRMMSQMMLLTAGQGTNGKVADAKIRRQQEQIMQNIQNLIEKPIVIQREGIDQSQQSNFNQLGQMQESVGSKKSRKSGVQQRFSSIEQSVGREAHAAKAEKAYGDDRDSDIEEEVIESEIQDSLEESIKESIDRSQQYKQEQQQIANARRMLGSEKAIIEKSKSVLEQRPQRPSSLFEKNSFQDYTSKKFKNLLFDEGTVMDDVLDQIEQLIDRKSDKDKKILQKQLDTKLISPRTFRQKSKDLEVWAYGERKEIISKRKKVQDTCGEIAQFMNKLDKDKKLMLDGLNSSSNTPRGLRRSASQISASGDSEIQIMKEQMHELKQEKMGGEAPETRYLNKKRDLVKKLMREKKDAVERKVRDKMKNLESDMIDEMMQTALNLDVDDEVERRIEKARQVLEQGQIEESVSKSEVSKSAPARRTAPTMASRSSKKNVKFQQASSKESSQGDKYSQSFSHHQDSSVSQSRGFKSQHLEASGREGDDDIGESIQMEESYAPSSSASKIRQSDNLKDSVGKASRSNRTEKIEERDQEEENSFERDDEYSNDFVSESIQSLKSEQQKLRSGQALASKVNDLEASKAADIEESGYTEAFEDASVGQSQSTMKKQIQDLANSRQNNEIGIVDEEDDIPESSNGPSKQESSRQSESQRDSVRTKDKDSEYQDKEVVESTSSVDWMINLQRRSQALHGDQSAPEPSGRDGLEESEQEQSSEMVEEIDEREEIDGQDLEDLESCPSGSLGASKQSDEDMRLKADEITAILLEQILDDFKHDDQVKMEVEDDIDEEEFEDKWPYSLEKKQEEQQEEKSLAPAQPAAAEEQKLDQQENEAKKKHDQQMQKYHEEQKQIEEHHKKVVEYLDCIIEIVDKEVLQQALQKPIEHDPLKILEKIQALDTEDEIELTNMTYSQQQSALPAFLFDEIEKRLDEVHQGKEGGQGDGEDGEEIKEQNNVSRSARNAHHLAIFDAFNEALDQERPYKFKGLPNPWSKQTRVTHETLSAQQVDQIINRARGRVVEWDKTGAGTKFAPAPPPPPLQSEYDPPHLQQAQQESEDERNKAERQERLGLLLTKEVHQREQDWLDYEIEDTQARFDLADMILEALADEVAQFLDDRMDNIGDSRQSN